MRNIINFLIVLIIIFSFSLSLVAAETVNLKDNISKNEFLVGFTELYYGENNLTGDIELLDNSYKYGKNVNMGRINLYLQNNIKDKYFLTAYIDTGENKLDQLLNNLNERKNNYSFAGINPENHYPVYGDNSTISSEVDTDGKVYLALESDEFKTLWGNYSINYNNNELIDYNRSQYGFNLNYDNNPKIKIFYENFFSLHSQEELKLTGGKIYYLKNKEIMINSENLKIEKRNKDTSRVRETIILEKGIDYEINYAQGRVLFNRNSNKIIEENSSEKINEDYNYYLVADYDYDYKYSNTHNYTYGMETAYNISDKLLIGASYLQKYQDQGKVYQISGLNLDYISSLDEEFNFNFAQSENILSGNYISYDGGFNFSEKNLINNDDAQAYSFNYQKEVQDEGNIEIAYTNKEKGFSSGSQSISSDTIDFFVDLSRKEKDESSSMSFNINRQDKKAIDVFKMDYNNKYNEKIKLRSSLENKIVRKEESSYELTGSFGMDYKYRENKLIYLDQKLTLDKSENLDNSYITTLGGEIKKEKWKFNVEGKAGNSNEINLGAGYQLNEKSEIYTSVKGDYSKDEVSTETTVGTETKVNKNLKISGEYREDNTGNEEKKDNILKFDYLLSDNWNISFDYTRSKIDLEKENNLERNIIGLGAGYRNDKLRFNNSIEYRKDKGKEDLKQLVMTGNFFWNYQPNLKIISEVEYIEERGKIEKKYGKGTIGLAYRPVKIDNLNLVAKYHYLNLKNSADENEDRLERYFKNDNSAEKAQVFSLDAIYDLNIKWQLVEKIAFKYGDTKINSLNDEWITNETYFWANRLNYQLRKDIDLFGEYRILDNSLAQDRKSGFLFGGFKKFEKNLKLGVGYNFTDFNDNLTDLNYESEGWFINIIKAW